MEEYTVIDREKLENYLNVVHPRVCEAVDLDAVLFNMRSMHRSLGEPTKLCAVIKTDGYGMGAVPIAHLLEKEDYVWGMATATCEEAYILRESGIKKPILILGYTFPETYEELVLKGIRPAVFRFDQLEALDEAAAKLRREGYDITAPIHIAVDTGMSRIGIKPDDGGAEFVREALGKENLTVEGIFTHFARADEADLSDARNKKSSFADFVERVEKENRVRIPIHHCANSASIIDMPEAGMDMARAGITIYGMWPSDETSKNKVAIKPVMSLHSHIVFIKELEKGTPISYGGTYVTDRYSRIATIPVGYGDGYPRSLSGKGYVLIHGKKAPILGRVCMDQFMVDVTDIHEAAEGDDVTLIGRDYDEVITIEELGDLSGRFNYELSCDINHRVPRVYIHNEGEFQS
ncbi:alanine racemase [Butyrivibrio sp. MC2013]|uniref:alanine racemase n=1 Tax=Butyrivibrio sp. MC2013 TaxID=1280686 RepID=UPI00042A8839|nr:alanine racemase [Butyrivibrio sp. MC2013]